LEKKKEKYLREQIHKTFIDWEYVLGPQADMNCRREVSTQGKGSINEKAKLRKERSCYTFRGRGEKGYDCKRFPYVEVWV